MIDRTKLLLAAALLVLVVGAGTSFWFLSSGDASPSIVGSTESGAMAMAPAGASSDVEREPIPLDRAAPIPMTVYLSPTCTCCSGWVDHIQEHGFEVALEYRADMNAVKEGFLIAPEISSCHTAVVNGYIIEGHVPGDVVREFLADAPAVRGLAAPGMPVGSPGMEVDGQTPPYDVVTFTTAGEVTVYSRQGRG